MYNKLFSARPEWILALSANEPRQASFKFLLLFTLLFARIVAFPGLFGQTGEYSFQSVNCTGLYEVSYETCSGCSTSSLDFLVTIDFDDSSPTPTLGVSIAPSSWLFDSTDSTIVVEEYSSSSGEVVYSVSVTRDDGIAQSGNGAVLRIQTSDGLVIVVEDFPAKTNGAAIVSVSPESDGTAVILADEQIKSVTVRDMQGREVAWWNGTPSRTVALDISGKRIVSPQVYVIVTEFLSGSYGVTKTVW